MSTVVSRVNDSIILPNRKRFFQPAQPVYHFVELSFCRIEKYKILGQPAAPCGKPKKSPKVIVFSLETLKIPKIFAPAAQSFFGPFRIIYHFVELSFCRIEKYENLGRPSAGTYHFVELSFTRERTVS